MLFDILAVFVVTLLSSLFSCSTSVHGLPTSPSAVHLIQNHPSSADLSSSLRLFSHHPVPSVDYDLGGDISAMLMSESNEFAPNDESSSPSDTSSFDTSNEPFDDSLQQLPSKSLSRKLFFLLQKQDQDKEEVQNQEKRSISPSIGPSPSLPTQFNLNSAVAAARFADPSHANSVVNFSQLSESTRLSPSLKVMVETNPFARAWLTMLLQKVMEEQPVPYIFKYGRRRK